MPLLVSSYYTQPCFMSCQNVNLHQWYCYKKLFIFIASCRFQIVHTFLNNKIRESVKVLQELDDDVMCELVLLLENMSLVVRKPVFGVSDQVRHKPGCAATGDG